MNTRSDSVRLSVLGWLSTRASMFTANVVRSAECLNSWLRTDATVALRASSITMRIPWRSDSSRRSEMPSMRLLRTMSAMRSMSVALLTWYGSSVTTI